MADIPIYVKPIKLWDRLLDSTFLDENGRIKEDLKFKINIPQFNIQNSKISGKPNDKFETTLFLPEGEDRQGEGGLRTRGYFKHSYKLIDSEWYITDSGNNPAIPAPEDIQSKIKQYLSSSAQYQIPITEFPLITVITVVYNGAKYLEATILSVINQTYPNVEYIIIDGGSTDDTLDIIKKYEDYIDYWVSERDKGISDAFNKGITLASGRLLGLINSDDWYELNAVETIVKSYSENNEGVYCGNLLYWKNNKKSHISESCPSKLYKEMTINHPTTFISLEIYKKVGLFKLRYKYAMDYELILRIYKSGYPICNLKTLLANMRYEGKSDINWYKAYKEVREAKRENQFTAYKAFMYFLYHIIRNIIRELLTFTKLDFLVDFYRRKYSVMKKYKD